MSWTAAMVDSGPMRRRAILRSAALAVLALCTAGAPTALAQAPGLADRWKDAQAIRPALRKVLVVGITPDAHARRAFEDRFVSLLRGRDVEAITSYSIVPDLGAAQDPATVRDALLAQRVEGLITVRLTPLGDPKEEAWAAGWREAMTGPERAREYVETGLRAFDAKSSKFGVEVAFWSMDDGRRIWAGRFKGQSIKFLRGHASEMAQSVIDEMVFQGLF